MEEQKTETNAKSEVQSSQLQQPGSQNNQVKDSKQNSVIKKRNTETNFRQLRDNSYHRQDRPSTEPRDEELLSISRDQASQLIKQEIGTEGLQKSGLRKLSQRNRENGSSLVQSQAEELIVNKNAASFADMTLELSLNTFQPHQYQQLSKDTNSNRELNFNVTNPAKEQYDNHQASQIQDQSIIEQDEENNILNEVSYNQIEDNQQKQVSNDEQSKSNLLEQQNDQQNNQEPNIYEQQISQPDNDEYHIQEPFNDQQQHNVEHESNQEQLNQEFKNNQHNQEPEYDEQRNQELINNEQDIQKSENMDPEKHLGNNKKEGVKVKRNHLLRKEQSKSYIFDEFSQRNQIRARSSRPEEEDNKKEESPQQIKVSLKKFSEVVKKVKVKQDVIKLFRSKSAKSPNLVKQEPVIIHRHSTIIITDDKLLEAMKYREENEIQRKKEQEQEQEKEQEKEQKKEQEQEKEYEKEKEKQKEKDSSKQQQQLTKLDQNEIAIIYQQQLKKYRSQSYLGCDIDKENCFRPHSQSRVKLEGQYTIESLKKFSVAINTSTEMAVLKKKPNRGVESEKLINLKKSSDILIQTYKKCDQMKIQEMLKLKRSIKNNKKENMQKQNEIDLQNNDQMQNIDNQQEEKQNQNNFQCLQQIDRKRSQSYKFDDLECKNFIRPLSQNPKQLKDSNTIELKKTLKNHKLNRFEKNESFISHKYYQCQTSTSFQKLLEIRDNKVQSLPQLKKLSISIESHQEQLQKVNSQQDDIYKESDVSIQSGTSERDYVSKQGEEYSNVDKGSKRRDSNNLNSFYRKDITNIQKNLSDQNESSYVEDANQIFTELEKKTKILIEENHQNELSVELAEVEKEIHELKLMKPKLQSIPRVMNNQKETPFKPNYKKMADIADDNEKIYEAKILVRKMNQQRKEQQQRKYQRLQKIDDQFKEIFQSHLYKEDLKYKYEIQRKNQIQNRIDRYHQKQQENLELQKISNNFVKQLMEYGPRNGQLAKKVENQLIQVKGGMRKIKIKDVQVELPKIQQRKFINQELIKQKEDEMLQKYKQSKIHQLIRKSNQ